MCGIRFFLYKYKILLTRGMTTTLNSHTLPISRPNGLSTSADMPRPPQSPRHFFEKLYGHLETTNNSSHISNSNHQHDCLDSVVLSRSMLMENHQGTQQLDTGIINSKIRPDSHSPPQHSNMSGSSADISDTRYLHIASLFIFIEF